MTTPHSHPQVEVDARGLRCPLPVIRLAQALRDLPAGSPVRLLATDPATRIDVPAFCRMRGADLLQVDHLDDHSAYLVRVSSTAPATEPAGPPGAGPDSPDD